jgi:hypothetical protein
MTRAQQTQVLTRLRELEAALASVSQERDGLDRYVDERRSPGYIVGRCQALVDVALREAGEKVEGR